MIFDKLDYLKKFERELLDIQKLSKSTHDSYSERLEHFFYWCERRYFDPIEINNPDAIKEYLSQFENANTLSHSLCALKKFYDDVLNMPLVVRYIKYPKKKQVLPNILSKNDLLKMLEHITNEKQRFIFLLLFSCGLRKGEIQRLEEKHFDLFRDVIIIKDSKGGKDRLLPLSPILKNLFFSYKEYRTNEIKKFHFVPKWFFVGQFGEQYQSVNAFLKTATEKAGIHKRVYQHLIRHCYGTYMREKLIDIATIGELMGHASGSKITFLYARLSNTVRQNAGTPLEDLMAQKNSQQLLKSA